MAGLLVGAMLPFVFSALSMNAVGRAAMAMIEEVRRQFKDIPALKAALEVMRKYDSDLSKASAEDRAIFDAADGVAEYDKCVAISTQASIKEMVMPGLLAIIVPVLVGFLGGAEMLGGLLAGVTASGVLMAIFQSNAGGAWDNAKKTIESEGRKGSDAHKAAVVGDTVGDPFKDTSGPSLNILLKLMSVVALVIAPSLVSPTEAAYAEAATTQEVRKEISVNVQATSEEGGVEVSVVTTETTNGETTTTEVAYAGADLDEVMEEVRANHPEVTIKKEIQE
jgi:K(+)-stimulated pyrophosphate-energized sodium pump